MVSCEAHHLPKQLMGNRGIGECEEKGPQGPFSFAYTKLARLGQYKTSRSWSFLQSRKEKGLDDGWQAGKFMIRAMKMISIRLITALSLFLATPLGQRKSPLRGLS